MFETIGVLIVFFFLLVAGAAFYFQLQKGSFKRQLRESAEQESLQLVQRALYLPELDCSFVSIQKENCFDVYKVGLFSELLKQETVLQDYFPVFGYSEVMISTVYPEKSEHVLYANPLPGRDRIATQSPILLYNATTKSYAFGVIEVKHYVE
ncbi:hypothetical protein HY490_04530 [Candidatus Woesearchaeota archaeon]|nr:hypothetical protein [Candidatus Woesearchaeota archaeon]